MLNKLSYILTLTTVRLVSPTNSLSSGRVEVFYNGTWGTICDDSWDLQDADVVCRQLGYNGASSAPADAVFGQGTGPIWLDDVNCEGNETSITQCSHGGWGVHKCGHGKNANVVCRQLKGKLDYDLANSYFPIILVLYIRFNSLLESLVTKNLRHSVEARVQTPVKV